MPHPSATRGLTLVETMIVAVVTMVAFWAFYEVMVRTSDANDYAMAFNSLCGTAQRTVNDIREDLSVAKLLFRNSSTGQGYLAAASLPPEYPILGQSRLPGQREGGIFQKNTAGTSYTGNVLLFVRTELPYEGSLRYRLDTTKRRPVRIDLYRLVVYYLSKVPGARIGGVNDSLTLVRAGSALFADYLEVTSITDPVPAETPDLKAEALADLYNNQGIRYLWNTTADAPAAFYPILLPGGGAFSVSATPDPLCRPLLTAPTEFIRNLRFRHASVSWNVGTTFRSPVIVPAFGLANPAGDGFPHGFEVQVIGLSGARQTLVCLALARQTPGQRLAAHSARIVISSKDYF